MEAKKLNAARCHYCNAWCQVEEPYTLGACKACKFARRKLRAYENKIEDAVKRYVRWWKKLRNWKPSPAKAKTRKLF